MPDIANAAKYSAAHSVVLLGAFHSQVRIAGHITPGMRFGLQSLVQTYATTHTRTNAHTHARTRTHTHTHTRARAHPPLARSHTRTQSDPLARAHAPSCGGGFLQYKSAGGEWNAYRFVWLLSIVTSTLYTYFWDVLFEGCTLRAKRMYSRRIVYYSAPARRRVFRSAAR